MRVILRNPAVGIGRAKVLVTLVMSVVLLMWDWGILFLMLPMRVKYAVGISKKWVTVSWETNVNFFMKRVLR